MADMRKLQELAKLVRYYILMMTTRAGSGHPTSSLSACDLMVALFFNKLRYDLKNPQSVNNDRVIFSKGHASPLFYALYAAAGVLTEKDLLTYRKFRSNLEGHPRPNFKYAEAATGSLGQGLSIGVGMALGSKLDKLSYNTYVLMGDSEVAEGSIWEAMEVASYYKLDNLVGILDVNRLGQSRETMLGWDTEKYRARAEAFGWEPYVCDGHNLEEIMDVYTRLDQSSGRPKMIIAKTIKGKGVPFLENKEGWHGKALGEEEFKEAVFALGKLNRKLRGKIEKPLGRLKLKTPSIKSGDLKLGLDYKLGDEVATRRAFGDALVALGNYDERIVSLDGETSNSTFSEIFAKKFPERYFEMFIAEQNMVGTALGFSKRGKVPFVSTFSAFLTRAYDQIRMSAYSGANIKFVGSHSGVSIGEDGPSQMGLEEVSMFRSIFGSRVFVPADAVSCAKLVEIASKELGIFYIGTLRPPTPVIYGSKETFKTGGSKVLRKSARDRVTVIACGICVPEALAAADEFEKKGISVRVVDAYSIKPIDGETIKKAARETNGLVITVEDHYSEGGLGDAVLNVFADDKGIRVVKLAVSKMPMSGKGGVLLNFEGISSKAIVSKIKEIVG
jgi:transketolase